jgi:hypothetical protein
MTPDAERLTLWLLVGKRVQGEATLTGRRRQWGQRLALLLDVELDGGEVLEHLWVELPPYIEKQVAAGERFRFDGLVREYERVHSGVPDVTLAQVRLLGKVTLREGV